MDSETCFPRGKPKPMEEKEKKHREKMRKEIQAENADNYLFARVCMFLMLIFFIKSNS